MEAVLCSDTAADFLCDIGTGAATPTQIVKYCRSLAKSPSCADELRCLSRFGTVHYNNVERDMHKFFSDTYAVEPYPLDLDVYDDEGNEIRMRVPALAVHEMFAAMLANGSDVLAGPACSPLQYWNEAAKNIWGREHPANCEYAAHKEHMVPINLHSDGVETYRDTEYHCFSWSSALSFGGRGDTFDRIVLILLLVESCMISGVTFDQVIAFITWSFAAMSAGIHPFRDHLGRPLTGKRAAKAGTPLFGSWRGIFSSWLGDSKASW